MASYNAIVEVEQDGANDDQLEFQSYVLSTAEAQLASSATASQTPRAQTASGAGAGAGAGPPTAADFSDPLQNQQQQPATSAGRGGFWNLSYYEKWFDVDSDEVGKRMLLAILPRGRFLEEIQPNIDLYGPFWIPTTVIFSLFVTSSMAASIMAYASGVASSFNYNNVTLLSIATSSIYTYMLALPAAIWGLSRYFQCPMRFIELLSIYGYGFTIYIPVMIACILPMTIVRYSLLALAFALSSFFMLQSLVPAFSESPNKAARVVVASLVVVAQLGITLVMFFGFFRFVAVIPKPS